MSAQNNADSENEKIIIMPNDPQACQRKTLDLWVSRNGKAFSDESAARLDGATHTECADCKSPIDKKYYRCSDCTQKYWTDVHKKRERTKDFEWLFCGDDWYRCPGQLLEDVFHDTEEGEEFTEDQISNMDIPIDVLESLHTSVGEKKSPILVSVQKAIDEYYDTDSDDDTDHEITQEMQELENKINDLLIDYYNKQPQYVESDIAFDWAGYITEWKEKRRKIEKGEK